MKEYLACWSKFATFSGRARRREYWMFVLFNFLIGIACQIVDHVLGTSGIIYAIYTLAVIIPGFAVFCRRMHDVGRSGWWWLIAFVPIIGWILLLIWTCSNSEPGQNKYGPSPKGV